MSATDNLGEIERSLNELVEGIALDNANLGDDLFDVVSKGVAGRSAIQQAPDGSTWPDNDPDYAASKGNLPVGVRTGLMLSPEQLHGDRRINATDAEMEYGVSSEARQHAVFFSGTSAQGRDARGRFATINTGRPFWDFGGRDIEDMNKTVERFLDKLIARLGS